MPEHPDVREVCASLAATAHVIKRPELSGSFGWLGPDQPHAREVGTERILDGRATELDNLAQLLSTITTRGERPRW